MSLTAVVVPVGWGHVTHRSGGTCGVGLEPADKEFKCRPLLALCKRIEWPSVQINELCSYLIHSLYTPYLSPVYTPLSY